MSRKTSAGSMLWGVVLIFAGAVFLANNLGYEVRIWEGIARYWPVLLIAWGLLKLVDYYRWQQTGREGSLFSGGEIVLLIFVLFVGSALTAAANISPEIGELFEIADIELWDIAGQTFEYTEHYEQNADSG